MFIDRRSSALETLRAGLQTASYPIKVFLYSPIAASQAIAEFFVQRDALQRENESLKEQILKLEISAMRRADLELENTRLRALTESTTDVASKTTTARIVGQEFSRQRRRVTIGLGSRAEIYVGQTVVAGGGILGQTMRVGPFSSEIILLTDPEHAIPIEIQRTGVRTIAVGTGRANTLNLPSLPLQSDIIEGDVLVSSGLGGIFPAGYPVAVVSRVMKNNSSQLAAVEAITTARAGRTRHVALIWFKENHPAAPANTTSTKEIPSGSGAAP